MTAQFEWTYPKKCEPTRLTMALQRRFPNWSGGVERKGDETVIRVMAGITESDKPTVDRIVERHVLGLRQARSQFDAAGSMQDKAKRLEEQVSIIARFLDLTDT